MKSFLMLFYCCTFITAPLCAIAQDCMFREGKILIAHTEENKFPAKHKIDHLRVHFQFKGIVKVADNTSYDIGFYYKSEVNKENKQEDLIRLARCIMDAG